MNYVINSGGNNATIQAIASNGITILESDNLITAPGGAISTPNATNGGAFRGISRAQNDIAFFRVSGDYIILHSLEIGAAGIAGTATPEPATALTGGLALAGLVLLRRLRTRA